MFECNLTPIYLRQKFELPCQIKEDIRYNKGVL